MTFGIIVDGIAFKLIIIFLEADIVSVSFPGWRHHVLIHIRIKVLERPQEFL